MMYLKEMDSTQKIIISFPLQGVSVHSVYMEILNTNHIQQV